MDLAKSFDYFDPFSIKGPIHIIGCGATGSTLAENLARLGVQELHLWDFDTVSPHDVANQMFFNTMVGMDKISALSQILKEINPDITLTAYEKGWHGETLSGHIFLCIDKIDIRREIVTVNRYNPYVEAFYDFRLRLTDAQHYTAYGNNQDSIDNLLKSMNFTSEEAKAETPTNLCGTTLNVVQTVRTIVGFGVANFVNFVKKGVLKKLILVDTLTFTIDAF